MRRWMLIVGIGIIVLAVVLVGGFWYLSVQPLYQPGTVSDGENLSAPLVPPTQSGDAYSWTVESSIDLSHFEVGSGRNVLVVHGGPGIPFAEPIDALQSFTDEHRFHYYDQRGSGDSSRPIDRFESSNTYRNMQELDRVLGLGAQIADIERIRQILGDEKLVLIGHSWGGLLASLYAVEFPQNVEKLILVTPANMLVMPQPKSGGDIFDGVRGNLAQERHDQYDNFVDDYFAFRTLFTRSDDELVALSEQFGEYFAQAVGGTLPESKRPGGWMVWAQYVSMGRRHDYRSALASVEAPVLVIHGADDFTQNESASRAYVEAFPNAEFVVIDGAKHFPFIDQPEAFVASVSAFLERPR